MSKYSSFSTDNINIRPTNSQNAGTSNYNSTQGAVTGCTGCGGGSSTNACAAANSRIISGGGKKRGRSRKRTRRAGRSRRYRRSRRSARRSKQYGGKGYSMSNTQTIHANNKVPEQTSYSNPGISSSLNLGASKQYAGLQTGGRRRRRGGKSGDSMRYDTWADYFGFKDVGGSLGTFAGSGYPPYTRGSNNSCPSRGGKRRRGRRTRRTRK